MIERITLTRAEADDLALDLASWAESMECDGEGDHPWVDQMQRHARMLTDKLAGRIE